MGAVKSVGHLYGSPTALTSQYLAGDRYCTYVVQTPGVKRRIFLEQIRRTRTSRGRRMFNVSTKFTAEFTYRCVQKPNKRTYEEQESIVFSSSFFAGHYCAKAKKSNPSSLELNRTPAPALDLPHSLVFVVLFSSMNFCVGDIKHIKTTANKFDLERILQTLWALFCISPQSPPRKLFILITISKPCSPFTAICEETSTLTPDFFPGIC